MASTMISLSGKDEDNKDVPQDDTCPALLDQLLANNRQPKVSELRTALTASYYRNDTAAQEEAIRFMTGKVSGASQAMMAFCDAVRLYRKAPVACETRQRGPEPLTGGGIVDGVGLYATRNIAAGELITEFEIHAVKSKLNCDDTTGLYFDPRIIDQKALDEQQEQNVDELEALLAEEAISLNFGHTVHYFVPLVLAPCQHKQWQYANDTMPCPQKESYASEADWAEAYATYKESAERANCMGACVLGFAAHLVASKSIAAGEEILYHWGSDHWDQLRQLQDKGLGQIFVPPAEDGGAL